MTIMPRGVTRKDSKYLKRPPYHPPLIISIHGIRTTGQWQKIFASVASASPTRIESFYYGRYGLFRFLCPYFNKRLVDRFYRWYGDVVKSCPDVDLERFDKRPSVVAHSLGSWVVGNAMLKYEDIRFDKLVLAGSILPGDFDWATLFARDQVAFVRNECGQKDPWPRWAGRLVSNTGSGGSDGFDWFGTSVANVRCNWFEHSDSLMRQHIENFWLPVLRQAPSPLTLLHGREVNDRGDILRIFDQTGAIDSQVYGELPNYSEVEIPHGLALAWIKINPDIYTFLIDRETRQAAGYLNAMPVDDALYEGIRTGQIVDNQVPASGIMPFLGTETVKIYLMSLAIAEKHRRWGDGIMQQGYVQLLTGFLDKLLYYAKNYRIRVTHLLATAWTPEGHRMCEFFAMTKIGVDRFGDSVFELNLETLLSKPRRKISPALRQLLRAYQEL